MIQFELGSPEQLSSNAERDRMTSVYRTGGLGLISAACTVNVLQTDTMNLQLN